MTRPLTIAGLVVAMAIVSVIVRTAAALRKLDAGMTAERTRSRAAEESIACAISAETNRALAAESILGTGGTCRPTNGPDVPPEFVVETRPYRPDHDPGSEFRRAYLDGWITREGNEDS